ncbi:helix-turn-helix transcriptional regulator [Saccharothrix sp. 6-C]|uniref:helix-turn-helix transcriptional regulator n=1 Tax=Saccharothrix sp. 6-C TaxID=2781735 RepID=UPI0019175A11|nr:helix-turn-helix transcriptional regulator [Saccharothrix sp. 6-C]QQQ74297.1 helix-turn-helix transcriptional regulator [Saccharothrix sp. 6-C]
MQTAVERAIDTMWSRYHEPLSLADMADTAILSKFYFSRVFRTLTGTSPGRFLTAIRLTKAKQLLLETSLSVTEISYMVGYNSLGTFTSRFTRSVGVPPARYRALSYGGILSPSSFSGPARGTQAGAVAGWVGVPETSTPVRVYVGAFKDPIAQGVPVACDIRDGSGPYRLEALPEGRFYLRVAVVAVDDLDPNPSKRRPLFVGAAEAGSVRAGRTAEADIETRSASTLDLPILLALPELDTREAPDVDLAVPAARTPLGRATPLDARAR